MNLEQGHCPYDWDYVIENLGEWFLGNLGRECPASMLPCSFGRPDTTFEVQLGTCWEIVNTNPDPTGVPIEQCRWCVDETGYCLVSYEACCDDVLQHVVVTRRSSTLVTSEGCTLTFDPNFYTYGQCYIMLSCE